MKRLLALVLALALCVTLFAFAETAPEEPEMVASPSLEEEYLALLSAVMARYCQHTYTRTFNETDNAAGEYTDNGDGTHTYTGAYWQVRQCTDCGAEIERVPVKDKSYTEPHDFTDSYDGTCVKCGGVCKHDGGKGKGYIWMPGGEYRSNYDGTHTYDMYEVVVYCTLCGDALNNGGTTEVTEQCSLDENGVCMECDVKPNCSHEHRAERYYSEGISTEDVYTDNGDGTHTFRGECYVGEYCLDCGADLMPDVYGDDSGYREVTYTELHDFSYGSICRYCKAHSPYACNHQWETLRERDIEEYVYAEMLVHAKTVTHLRDVRCKICSIEETQHSSIETIYEPHTLVEGQCACGYGCEHEWDVVDEYTKTEYEDMGNNRHRKTVTQMEDMVCKLCGQEMNGCVVNEDETNEPHSLREGKCVCGYGCEHEWVTENTYDVIEYYWTDDDNMHEKIVSTYKAIVCKFCGSERPEGDEEINTTTEEHSNITFSFIEDTKYEPVNEQQHKKVTLATEMHLCTLCGFVLPDTDTPVETTETEPHAFVDGRCICCGYRELPPATPTPTPTPVVTEAPEPTPTPTPVVTEAPEPTPTPTPVVTEAPEPTPTPTPVVTEAPEPTPTPTPVVTEAPEPTPTPTPVVTEAPEPTPTPTPVVTEAPEPTPTPTPVVTEAPEPTPTPTPVVTEAPEPTPTPTPVVTEAPEPTPTPTPVVTEAPEPTPTPTPVVTEAPEPTPTPTPVVTEAPEPTPTPTPVVTEAPEPTMPVVSDEPIATPTPAPQPSDEQQEEAGAQGSAVPQATMEILKVPELLSSDEAAAFDALGLRERMLSFLAAVGYEEQVEAALTASGEQLSQAAIAAGEQLAQRIAAMDEAQKSEFDAWMTASFEPATVEVAGMTYDTLLLEVARVEGDSVEVRRYGFLDGDAWSFGERPLTAEEIAAAQNGLNAVGYDCGVVDGIAGPNTEAAVRAFQGDNGLAQTGKLTYETRRALAQA